MKGTKDRAKSVVRNEIAKRESIAKNFAKLPLDIQAYVKSEIALQMKKATRSLEASEVALRHRESVAGWIKFACWILLGGGFVIGTWLVAPSMIKEMVDARVTIPEIKEAATNVLEYSLDQLAKEKMVPFEHRAAKLEESLRSSDLRFAEQEQEMSLFSDINMARANDRAAYNRVKVYSRGKGKYAALCVKVLREINDRLLVERSALSYLVMLEHGFGVSDYRGPFSIDEIYDRIREPGGAECGLNVLRDNKTGCLNKVLLDVAARSEDLKAAESALNILESQGAPFTRFWNLSSTTNWVRKYEEKNAQFPEEDYIWVKRTLLQRGPLEALAGIDMVLGKFANLNKLRAAGVVGALQGGDIEHAKKLFAGHEKAASRWKVVSDCYIHSKTGDVSVATDRLIECHKKHPSLLKVMDAERYWQMSRFFDFNKILKFVSEVSKAE